MGASSWHYYVAYQPDLNAALEALQRKVFAEGDYWWAHGDLDKSASEYPNRPSAVEDLFEDEAVQESGTHSILDMSHVLADDDEPDFGTIQPVTPAEAMRCAGTELLTRDQVEVIDALAAVRWHGRCAILHDPQGQPSEIYFWGFSGD